MNGPGHYLRAERLISNSYLADVDQDVVELILAEAQVHATLALAAATLHSGSGDNGSGVSSDQWREVTR